MPCDRGDNEWGSKPRGGLGPCCFLKSVVGMRPRRARCAHTHPGFMHVPQITRNPEESHREYLFPTCGQGVPPDMRNPFGTYIQCSYQELEWCASLYVFKLWTVYQGPRPQARQVLPSRLERDVTNECMPACWLRTT